MILSFRMLEMRNGFTILMFLIILMRLLNNQNVEHLTIVTVKDGNVVDLMDNYSLKIKNQVLIWYIKWAKFFTMELPQILIQNF